MAKLTITDRTLQALKPRDAVFEQGYGKGFYIRVYPDGRKVARYRYQLAGKTRILTLGDYGRSANQYTLARLLNKHTAAQGKVAQSIDPALERDQAREDLAVARAEHEARLTLKDVCRDFQEHYQGRSGRGIADKTRTEYRKHIDGIILPKWGRNPVEALPIPAIITVMRSMPPVQANRLFTTLNLILNWAIKNGVATHNPLAGRDKPGGAEQSKTRALDYDPETQIAVDKGEITSFWRITEGLSADHRDALRLILLSGQRPGEVLSLRKSHLNGDTWRIPAAITKNKKGVHVVPVTRMMSRILEQRANREEDYLFPNSRGSKPILPNTLAHVLAAELKDTGDLEPFTPHDLRRTCATQLGALGYVDAEIGLLLNHASGGITHIYNRASPEQRIRPMLEAWHRRLKVILKGKQTAEVVELRG